MNVPRIKFLFVFGLLLLFSLLFNIWPAVIVFGFILVIGFLVTSKESNKEWDDQLTHDDAGMRIRCYYGDDLHFTNETITAILIKHFPFFSSLQPGEKQKFITRLNKFIAIKTFKIHDATGFREMPVLISATAIQLSFGLEEYLLPQFEFIHIYPEEFLRTSPSLRYLEGNVSGQSINISWKHFLEGFEYPADGQNVGLHEMAHALYYQSLKAEENTDDNFRNHFTKFNGSANKALEQEKSPGNDLYSEYGLRNLQEFWGESVEIFFERPTEMNERYPTLYAAMRELLNQDPVNNIFHYGINN